MCIRNSVKQTLAFACAISIVHINPFSFYTFKRHCRIRCPVRQLQNEQVVVFRRKQIFVTVNTINYHAVVVGFSLDR